MNILLIATTPLRMDGITKVEMDIIEYNHASIRFDVACPGMIDSSFGERLRELGVEVYDLPSKKNILAYASRIMKLVRSGKYDAVYIHGNSALMFFEALPARMAGAKKIITHCHNTQSDFPALHYILKPFFNRLVDIKIGCSAYAAKWAYNKSKVVVIPNGIDLNKFKYDETVRDSVRCELGWEDNLIVGHVGRFSKQKNHAKLIDIFEEMFKQNPSVRLLMVGDGELKDEIKDKINRKNLSEYVKFIDPTDNVSQYYQAMDVVVIPSLFEGFCLVAIEAQANGLPVVLSENVPPEASATDSAFTIDLNKNSTAWASEILNDVPICRNRDNIVQLYKKGFDIANMMDSVHQILTSNILST